MKVGINVNNELDRQAEFERMFMDNNLNYIDDWFVDDETLEQVAVSEYRIYEMDCDEVLMENAE